MAKRSRIPQYGTVEINGLQYYKTYVLDSEGKRIAVYGKTRQELYDKELEVQELLSNNAYIRKTPTVAEYCEKWLLMQSVHVRSTTLSDYTSKVKRHIISEIGHLHMADVTPDDIQMALIPVSKKSESVYKSVVILYKSIFRSAKASKVVFDDPTTYLKASGGVSHKRIGLRLPMNRPTALLKLLRDYPLMFSSCLGFMPV